jgi:TRAP-type C4-dicarboxylate transport system permease small subunit
MVVAGGAVVVMIGIFGWLVFGRYILNDTPTWVEQVSLLLINYITFLGAAVGVRRHTHLSIDFIREGFPRLPRVIMRCLSDLTVIVFGIFMAWQGWVLVSTNLEREIPMIGLSESWRAAPLLISGILFVLFAGADLLGRFAAPAVVTTPAITPPGATPAATPKP